MISMIVAAAENNAIGLGGKMPWHIPEDLKYFRRVTSGKTVIMGRKTFESIGRPLPKRRNIIVSRNSSLATTPAYEEMKNLEIFPSLEKAIRSADGDSEVFLIGGAEIYRQGMDICDRIYLTRVKGEFEADTYFPEIDDSFVETSREEHIETDPPVSFLVYDRRK